MLHFVLSLTVSETSFQSAGEAKQGGGGGGRDFEIILVSVSDSSISKNSYKSKLRHHHPCFQFSL